MSIDAIEKTNDKLNEQKDTMDKALSYAEYYLGSFSFCSKA